MKKELIFLVILTSLLLSSCGKKEVSGVIVEKEYEPRRVWIQMLPIYNGKIFTLMPITHIDDEDWILVIYNEEWNTTKNVYVTEETWNLYQPYDKVTFSTSFLSDPIEKEK